MTFDIRKLIPLLAFYTVFQGTFTPAAAQTGSLSPYSRYGIGDIYPSGFTRQFGMGGLGTALSDPNYINVSNPASYIADSMVVFDFGGRGEIRKLERTGGSVNYSSASLSHFALAFPVIRGKASMALGLLPYSSVGYDISVEEENTTVGQTVRYLYEGEGGFNRFFVGTGFKVLPGLHAGVNASYLFGTIDQIKSVEFPFGTNYFNSRYVNAVAINGFAFNAGLLYEKQLNNGLDFKAGVTSSLSSNVNAINSKYYFNYTYSAFSGGNVVKDSVFNETETEGKIRLPSNYSGGVSLGKRGVWLAGADFSWSNWENYENFDSKDTLQNSYTIHVGGERTFEKFIFRLGARYGNSYLNIRNSQLNDYGITFGIGVKKLFAKRPPSIINLGVELGQRGTTENNLIKEQYIRFQIGFSLTDIWFIKPKYD
jgi:hypothetical protein